MRRLAIAASMLVAIAGVMGMSAPDGNGGSLECGNAVATDLPSSARRPDDKSVSSNRAMPLTLAGVIAAAATLLGRRSAGNGRSLIRQLL